MKMLTNIILLISLCCTSLVLAAPVSPDVSDVEYLKALPSWNYELNAILPDDANLIASIRHFAESLDQQEGGDAGARKRDVAVYDDGLVSVRHSDVPDPSIIEKFDLLAGDSLNKREFTGAGWTDCSPSSWGEIPVNDYYTLRIIITMMIKHMELPSHLAMTTAKVGNTVAAVVQYDPGSSVFMTWDWNEWTRQIGELCVVNRQGLEGFMRPFGWPLRVGIMRTGLASGSGTALPSLQSAFAGGSSDMTRENALTRITPDIWQDIFSHANLPARTLARYMRMNRTIHEGITPILYREITITPNQLRSPLYDAFAAAMQMSGALASAGSSSQPSSSSSTASSGPKRVQGRSSALAKRRKLEAPPVRSASAPSAAGGAAASKAYSKVEKYDASRTRKAMALRCVKALNIDRAVDVDGSYKGVDFALLSHVQIVRLDVSRPEMWSRGWRGSEGKALDYLEPLRPRVLVLDNAGVDGLPDVFLHCPPAFVTNLERVVVKFTCSPAGSRDPVIHMLATLRVLLPEPSDAVLSALPPCERYSSVQAPLTDEERSPPADASVRRIANGLTIDFISYSSSPLIAPPGLLKAFHHIARDLRAIEERGCRLAFINCLPNSRPSPMARALSGEFVTDDGWGVRPNVIRAVMGMAEYVQGPGKGMLKPEDTKLWEEVEITDDEKEE